MAAVLALAVLAAAAAPAAALNTDGLALLALKFAVSDDPGGALATWRDADADPCGWAGVSCADGGGGRVAGVELANASLAGYLPSELSLLSELQELSLPYNRLAGQIPVAVAALQKLATLDLAHNLLSGQVPAGIGRLVSLARLDLSSNQLNGSLPPAIAGIPRLSGVLNLSYNHFTGGIPPEYGGIPVAVSLDLRGNDLAGEIPQVGSLVNQGPTAFDGNPRLCGFPLKVECAGGVKDEPRIPEANPGMRDPGAAAEVGRRPQKRRASPAVPILAAIVVVAIVAGVVLQWQCRRRCAAAARDEEKESTKEKGGTVTLAGSEDRRSGGGEEGEVFVAVDDGFGMELEELLRASAYVVGKSRGGIVYRVVPGRGPAVAVRRLSEPDDGDSDGSGGWRRRRAFEAEAAAIGRARHPNVARLRAYYYAPDEKLLIYDYLPNGSLHSALHGGPTASPTPLPWSVRLSIVQGAARGLAYLHECSPRRYVHGCIKSSKILLDDELRAHVSGFGLARLVAGAHKTAAGTSKKLGSAACALRGGAVSYVAPELRAPGGAPAAAATQKGDVFAFGVVLLEAVTGREPTEGEGGMDLLEAWVRRAFKEERPLSEVVDPTLLGEVHAKKQVLAVFHVALGCTEPDPEMRPRMRAVAESLDRIG
ncbi:putative inactive leucine-rich repeat receptor-like protein kinase [Panicum miliaceum]|uniref:Inactive leucine-rich repeat receptor-like protein kinase n=1 Tax=Panicum miliaceum TaxID=4540 RepID=A0A3L6RGQ7_PANMI|nr:putative inactive leucine-rich repeat receptor-like protein kinase [Panicum miliaceum]